MYHWKEIIDEGIAPYLKLALNNSVLCDSWAFGDTIDTGADNVFDVDIENTTDSEHPAFRWAL